MTNEKKTDHSKTENISVLFSDDHPLLRAGFTMTLSLEPGIEVVGESDTALNAIEEYKRLKPDVTVMDILFSGHTTTGLDALKKILEYDSRAAVVVLSQHDQPNLIRESYQIGAKSFIPKDAEPEILIKAIKLAAEGKEYFLPGIAEKLAILSTQVEEKSPQEILTKREYAVYCLVAEGKTSPEMAEILGVSVKSVANALYNLRKKLGITRNAEIAKHAIKHGVIELEH